MSDLTEQLMKQLRFISNASNAFLSQKKQKLTGQQRVLAVLAVEDGLNQGYLAEVLDLRPSSLAELLKKMELSGDILRQEDPNDKRIKRVFLTENGKEKAAQYRKQQSPAASDAFFAGLTNEEQEQFSHYLEKIVAGWALDFQKQSQKFIDPMDRLKAAQELQEAYLHQFDDWQNMTKEERRNVKRQMRQEMRDEMRNGDWAMQRGFGMPPRPPRFPRGFGEDPRAFRSREDFFGKGVFTRDDAKKEADSEDEWHDF